MRSLALGLLLAACARPPAPAAPRPVASVPLASRRPEPPSPWTEVRLRTEGDWLLGEPAYVAVTISAPPLARVDPDGLGNAVPVRGAALSFLVFSPDGRPQFTSCEELGRRAKVVVRRGSDRMEVRTVRRLDGCFDLSQPGRYRVAAFYGPLYEETRVRYSEVWVRVPVARCTDVGGGIAEICGAVPAASIASGLAPSLWVAALPDRWAYLPIAAAQ